MGPGHSEDDIVNDSSPFFAVGAVLGGLALFLFGMKVMTDGLRGVAGGSLRSVISKVGRNRFNGLATGTLSGFLIHSSATTVLLVAFVNAGILSVLESIPVIFGANIGTTFSMQMISLDIGAYSYFILAAGCAWWLFAPGTRLSSGGLAVIGLGMLFLGVQVMGDAVAPHGASLQPILEGSDSKTLTGMLYGILIAAAVTAIIQNSGATIGMCFALSQAGIFHDFTNVFPIVLGAHIGTCATALISSIGANIEARRCAVAHLVFNVIGVGIAVLCSVPLTRFILWTSDELVTQTANFHTAVMILCAAVLLPVTPFVEKIARKLTPSAGPPPQRSFLDPDLLKYPERAIQACIHELQRISRLNTESLELIGQLLLFSGMRNASRKIAGNEVVVNEIKLSMRDYFLLLTRNYLSRRQAILVQHLDRCVVDIERTGDHITALAELSMQRKRQQDAVFTRKSFDQLFALYKACVRVQSLVTESLDPQATDFSARALSILEAREVYRNQSLEIRNYLIDQMEEKTETPVGGYFYSNLVNAMDRIVRHSKNIALVEQSSTFWIKSRKLDAEAASVLERDRPELVKTEEYLKRIHEDDVP